MINDCMFCTIIMGAALITFTYVNKPEEKR